MTDISRRKADHLDIVLSGKAASAPDAAGFAHIRFEHVALPELDLEAVDVSTLFMSKRLRAPFLISSMTGGTDQAVAINYALAEAAGELGIAFAVGSQRVALEQGSAAGFDRSLRARAGDAVPLLANFGAAQLRAWNGLEMARRAIDMIEADAMIIHLNPLQEALQVGGDTAWSGLLGQIEVLSRALPQPLVVKEIGNGISGRLARRLVDVGVRYIDVAGYGGTSWSAVEGARAPLDHGRAVAAGFSDWGIPTAAAIAAVRSSCPDITIIGSGGIRDGVDAAKAIRVGADIVGQAAAALLATRGGPAAVVAHFRVMADQLRIACFCTGSPNLATLKTATLLP